MFKSTIKLDYTFFSVKFELYWKSKNIYKDNFNKRELLDNIRFREALELFPKCRDNGRETST